MKDVADTLHLDGTSMIGRFLSLRRLPADVGESVGWGRAKGSLNLTQAQEIARLRDPSDQTLLAASVIEQSMSGSEVRSVVQLVRNSRDSCSRAIEKTLALRPQVERRYLTVGAIKDDAVKQWLSQLSAEDRRNLIADLVPTDASGWSLSPSHFSISSAAPVSNADVLEANLNEVLGRKLREQR